MKNFILLLFLFSIQNINARENFLLNIKYPRHKVSSNSQNNFKKDSDIKIIKYKDLKNILIKNSNELKKYLSRVKQSESNLKNKYSEWKPKVFLKSNGLPKYTSGKEDSNINTDTFTEQAGFELDTTIEWSLINPSRRLEIKIAKEEFENAKLRYGDAIDDIYFEASKLYFLIQTSKQEIKVAKDSIKTSKFALNDAQNRFDSGISNKVDVLEARTQLGRSKLLLEKRKEELNFYKNSLAEILNIQTKFKIEEGAEKIIKGLWSHSLNESLIAAFKNRKDLSIDQNNIALNKKKSMVILSGKKPSFDIFNVYSINKKLGDSSVTSFGPQNITNSTNNVVGIRFALNLYDGGIIKQNYESSESFTEELISTYEQNKLKIKKDIENTFNELDSTKNKIIISSSQVDAAREALQISLKRLEAGITTQREVVNSQSDLNEAESNFINATYEYNTNISKLVRITGLEKNKSCNKLEKKGFSNPNFITFIKDKKLIKCEN